MEDLAYYDKICNGTIYEFDILSNKASLYATGIRGVTGIDYNNEGKIIGIFTGMKNEGERPIENDRDYLYIVKRDNGMGSQILVEEIIFPLQDLMLKKLMERDSTKFCFSSNVSI